MYKWDIFVTFIFCSTRIITAIIQFPLVICYNISYWILYLNLRLQGSRYQTYLYVTSNLEEFIRVIWEIKIAICENKEAIVTSLFECVKKCRSWPFSIVHFCTFRDTSWCLYRYYHNVKTPLLLHLFAKFIKGNYYCHLAKFTLP